MTAETTGNDVIEVRGAPVILGLRFRRYGGAADIPAIVDITNRANQADKIDEFETVEETARVFSNLKNSDPYRDMVIVEVDGKPVGHKRVEWWVEHDGTRIYFHDGQILPEWRGRGLGRALIRHSEQRLREIAREEDHPREPAPLFDVGVNDIRKGLVELVKSEGYEPTRYFFDMVRPNLEDIPDVLLPEGIQVRPVRPEDYRAIWEADDEAFRDHWGSSEQDEQDFVRWQNNQYFQPDIWQVAWDGDQVVGMVCNFILPEENERFGRLRGYTENISVRRPWRKRGVARALIARSFQVIKERGMREAALSVDAENASGALRLYESLGFRVVKSGTSYRKPVGL
ncbi:MAG: GNAT family N-acetyltransferase [Chloroflexia bacterium]